jgi:hypothetical protein
MVTTYAKPARRRDAVVMVKPVRMGGGITPPSLKLSATVCPPPVPWRPSGDGVTPTRTRAPGPLVPLSWWKSLGLEAELLAAFKAEWPDGMPHMAAARRTLAALNVDNSRLASLTLFPGKRSRGEGDNTTARSKLGPRLAAAGPWLTGES